MKTLIEYLNESKEDVQRFKIDNLKDELELNKVKIPHKLVGMMY